jgi:hypothetical protein
MANNYLLQTVLRKYIVVAYIHLLTNRLPKLVVFQTTGKAIKPANFI